MSSPLDSVQESAESVVRAQSARDETIREAFRSGVSAIEIAKASGLSRQRVYQIVGSDSAERRKIESRLEELDKRYEALVDAVFESERPPDSFVRRETAKRNGRRGKDARAGRVQRPAVLAEWRSFAESKLLRTLRDHAEDASVVLVLAEIREASLLRERLELLNDRALGFSV